MGARFGIGADGVFTLKIWDPTITTLTLYYAPKLYRFSENMPKTAKNGQKRPQNKENIENFGYYSAITPLFHFFYAPITLLLRILLRLYG